MFAKLLSIVLFLISHVAFAGWEKLASSSDGDVYIDESTIRKSGDRIKVWNLFDFKSERTISGERFRSARSMMEFDCVGETQRQLSHSFHSLKMGLGSTVHNETKVGEWEPVSPTSIGQTIFQHLCKVDKHRSKTVPTVYSSWPLAARDKNFEVRYDSSSITRSGSNVSVWVLLNHATPLEIERKKFKSTVVHSHIDCVKSIHRNGVWRAYTLQNGVGEYSDLPENIEWTKFNSDSIVGVIASIVCKDK